MQLNYMVTKKPEQHFFQASYGSSDSYRDVKGGFCRYDYSTPTITLFYGYTVTGFAYSGKLKELNPQSDFQSFIKEISDNGTALFSRKFTDEEKAFLIVKFGYPVLQEEDEDTYFQLVSIHEVY